MAVLPSDVDTRLPKAHTAAQPRGRGDLGPEDVCCSSGLSLTFPPFKRASSHALRSRVCYK